jgi:hypothetical protein
MLYNKKHVLNRIKTPTLIKTTAAAAVPTAATSPSATATIFYQ